MGRPREFDAEQVLERARETFWACGYEATSMDQIIEATGLAKQSLYNAFGDKHTLYLSCLDSYLAKSTDMLRAQLRGGRSVRAGIKALFDGFLGEEEALKRRGCMLVNSAMERAPLDPEVAERAAEAQRRMEAVFRDALEHGVQTGELELSRARVERLARFFVGAVLGLRVMAKSDPSSPALADFVRTTLEVLET